MTKAFYKIRIFFLFRRGICINAFFFFKAWMMNKNYIEITLSADSFFVNYSF